MAFGILNDKSSKHYLYKCLSTDTKPTTFEGKTIPGGSQCYETDTTTLFEFDGVAWTNASEYGSGGAAAGFTPSSYDADVTIVAGTASTGAIATGATKIQFVNQGTGDIRIAFGTSAADATTNLAITTVATTGVYLEDIAAWGNAAMMTLGVPALATHYAMCNATGVETPTVNVNQGV